VIAKSSLRAITQAPYPRAMNALLAATLAVLIDPIFRFSSYRELLRLLPTAGIMKFSGTLTLVFLQVVALFYLILLLPRILRTVALLLSVFVLVVQFSYWLTLSQLMTGTDLFLALTVGGENRADAVSSFFKPPVFLYALPYVLVLSALIFVPFRSTFRKTFVLSLLPALYLLASNYALFLHVPERSFHLKHHLCNR
jgi:hypothetical protein